MREYSDALVALGIQLGDDWALTDWNDRALRWRFFQKTGTESTSQGWKIHVSASAAESACLIRTAMPILASLAIPFKLPRLAEDIVFLNSGDAGASQLGKVLTLYPPCVDSARRAIVALDYAWPASNGPQIQTGRLARAGAAVSFRYGVHKATRELVDSTGLHEFALVDADGTLRVDRRAREQADEFVDVIFPVTGELPLGHLFEVDRLVTLGDHEMLPLLLLSRTARASVWLCAHTESMRTVVAKVGRRGVAGDLMGVDIRLLMQREFAVLQALAGERGLAPTALACLNEEQGPVLLMEDFRGQPLDTLGRLECIAALPALASAVARLHAKGLVHGDLKLGNAIQHGDGVGLLDFELTMPTGKMMRAGGTPGYLAPEVAGRQIPASTARDVYALGGCVIHALIGIPPGLLPPGRGHALLRQAGFSDAASLVRQLQASSPTLRPNAREAAASLHEQVDGWLARQASCGSAPAAPRMVRWCLRAASDVVQETALFLEPRNGEQACWRNEHFMRAHDCEGINLGAAGVILGLISLSRSLDRHDQDPSIAQAASWLAARDPAAAAAGAFTGNAGVALALVAAAKYLGDDRWLGAARARLHAAAADHRESDLFCGAAGVLWTACLMHDMLQERWPLELAEPALQRLHTLEGRAGGVTVWSAAPGQDRQFFGVAHGSAGVAMALARWARLVGDQGARQTAIRTWIEIASHGRADSESPLKMGPSDSRHHAVGNWCHGLGGYLWSILLGVGDAPELRTQIDSAVKNLAAAPIAGTPTYCHGLAGQLELWQMLRNVPRHSELARLRATQVARALRSLHVKVDGRCVWTSDDVSVVTPDLWIGFTGPATALALWAADVRAPLLSAAVLGGKQSTRVRDERRSG